MTGNGKLCKIYFKRLFFHNFLAFIDLFYWYHYICYFIFSDCMWGHVCLICTEEATTGGVLENFAIFTGKPTIKQKPTTIELIVYKHSTHIKLCYLACVRSEWKLSIPWSDSPPFFIPPDLHQKQKDKTLYSPSLLASLSYTKNQAKNSIYQVDQINTCD